MCIVRVHDITNENGNNKGNGDCVELQIML